jgi:hypothetical protein
MDIDMQQPSSAYLTVQLREIIPYPITEGSDDHPEDGSKSFFHTVRGSS